MNDMFKGLTQFWIILVSGSFSDWKILSSDYYKHFNIKPRIKFHVLYDENEESKHEL